MVKFLIVTHGPLAGAFKESARMFFGDEVEKINTIGLFPEDSVDALKDKIIESIKKNYTEDGIMIFVDIFAGSPFNMTALAMNEIMAEYPKLACYTGINMPLLMEALPCSEFMTLEEIGNQIESQAANSVINVRKALEF